MKHIAHHGGFVFCGTVCSRTVARPETFPLGSVLPYAARTFLPPFEERQAGLFQAKDTVLGAVIASQFDSSFLPQGVMTDSGWN